jgi:site-specific DNA-methyltransferase (adenine-specific)
MRHLCRLITPQGGTVLDPFCGSGTTGIAAIREGFLFIGVEKESEYHAIASARIDHALSQTASSASPAPARPPGPPVPVVETTTPAEAPGADGAPRRATPRQGTLMEFLVRLRT